MSKIVPYLTFSGNCREAMTFYKDCIGGDLVFNTIGESPLSEKMPPKMKESILHATLASNEFALTATDMVPSEGKSMGNNISLILNCDSETQIKERFYNLSEGGVINHALEITYWGATLGGLTDKYGNRWMLILQPPQDQL